MAPVGHPAEIKIENVMGEYIYIANFPILSAINYLNFQGLNLKS